MIFFITVNNYNNKINKFDKHKMSKILENFYIIIGCAPGTVRPNNILENILVKYNDLSITDFEITSKNFGDWTFNIKEDKEEIFNKYLSEIIEKLKELYNKNIIRYAEWNPN